MVPYLVPIPSPLDSYKMENFPDAPGSLNVTLKWNKQTFCVILDKRNASAVSFKEHVQSLTGVPKSRQKLLAKKGGWKGPLKDDMDLATVEAKSLDVTLIGSAETLVVPRQTTTFIEDLSPADVRAAQEAIEQAALETAQGMIQALQVPAHERDDGKQEMYHYNRLVTGLPQRQIEQELKKQQQHNNCLQGLVAMQLGLELRRAYINDLTVLRDGTCVSVLDDGHVQLWKHAAQQADVIHPGQDGEVASVIALHDPTGVAFVTAGRGTLQLWTDEADPLLTLPSAVPGTSPASLVHVPTHNSTILLAARMQITRQVNPTQFRLPPQNEAQRQRRTQAEAQERAVQQTLARAARSLQVWLSSPDGASTEAPRLQSHLLEPPVEDLEGSAPVTCVKTLFVDDSSLLVAGDAAGGLRVWKKQNNNTTMEHFAMFQLVSPENTPCSVVCLEVLADGRLAVSTDQVGDSPGTRLTDAVPIPIDTARAVHIVDFSSLSNGAPSIQSTLTGHTKDAVICMCSLPNGDLITGGGKLDATTKLWSKAQTQGANGESSCMAYRALGEVGYVFAMAVLPDAKTGSNYYALAAARYNTVKIII